MAFSISYIHHNDTQYNNTQRNEIQHNNIDKYDAKLSIVTGLMLNVTDMPFMLNVTDMPFMLNVTDMPFMLNVTDMPFMLSGVKRYILIVVAPSITTRT
jgi:hypothetical protein